ncbi:MAG: hypothetical protein ACP5SB_00815 [Caldisericaceae bacterium]
MKETDLLNIIKKSEDEAESITKAAVNKIDELRKHFDEEKERIKKENEEKLVEEADSYRTDKEKSFDELLKKLNSEKEEKLNKLRASYKKNFETVLREFHSLILEQKWQSRK